MKKLLLLTLMLFGLLLALSPKVLAESTNSHCTKCKSVCEDTLKYCKKKGGKHADQKHINALKDCIKACDFTSDLGSRNSALHAKAAAVCAEACNTCAASCEAFDDKKMKDCAAECRACAKMCASDDKNCCDAASGSAKQKDCCKDGHPTKQGKDAAKTDSK